MKAFGIGVYVMTYREQLELVHDQVDTLIDQIADRGKVISALHGDLSKSLEKVIGIGGDLKKFSATAYGSSLAVTLALADRINAEIEELGKLQVECRLALARAQAAMPAYAAYVTNGRHNTVPGRVFLASKSGGAKLPVDPQDRFQR